MAVAIMISAALSGAPSGPPPLPPAAAVAAFVARGLEAAAAGAWARRFTTQVTKTKKSMQPRRGMRPERALFCFALLRIPQHGWLPFLAPLPAHARKNGCKLRDKCRLGLAEGGHVGTAMRHCFP